MTSLAARVRMTTILFAVVVATWTSSQYFNFAHELTRLATENEQMRFADERMTRSRTDFERPGITAEEVRWIEAISDDYGIPPRLLYAMRRTENGGRGLYVGANWISPEIRKRYPPLWWQFAQAAKVWNQNLNRISISDPYLCHRTLWSFAHQWAPDPTSWTASVMSYLDDANGPKGLAVTEPPRKSPTRGKAKGGGHKPSKKHEQGE
jgi:hypothetical protein